MLIEVNSQTLPLWSPPGNAFYASAAEGGCADTHVVQIVGELGCLQREVCNMVAEASGAAPPTTVRLSFFCTAPERKLAALNVFPLSANYKRAAVRLIVDIPDTGMLRAALGVLDSQLVFVDTAEELHPQFGFPVFLRALTRKETDDAIKGSVGKNVGKFEPAVREAIHEASAGLPERIIDAVSRVVEMKKGEAMSAVLTEDQRTAKELYDKLTAPDIAMPEACAAIVQVIERKGWRAISRHVPTFLGNDILGNAEFAVASGLVDLLRLGWDTRELTIHSCLTVAAEVRKQRR